MNKFDFFNYNFSALISIFAALLGMAYPLILQAIQRVDDMYNSTVLAKYAQKQFAFRLFNVLLLVSIVVSITAPFIIAYLLENSIAGIVVELVQAVIITALICSAIYLFKFILVTTRPDDFLEYISSHNSPKNPTTHEILQIAKYASDHESYGLYAKAMDTITDFFTETIRKDKADEELATDVCNTITDIRTIVSTPEHRYFNDGNYVSSLFYYDRNLSLISRTAYNQVWGIIDRSTDNNLFSLVKRYWMDAENYYQMQVTTMGQPREGNTFEDVYEFKGFHYLVGVMLVLKEQWANLHQLLMPKDVEKVDTPLIPTSLCEILEYAKRTMQDSTVEGAISSNFTLNCLSDTIFGYEHIGKASLRYAALLIIRLSLVGQYFLQNDHCLDAPEFSQMSESENKEYLDLINNLKSEVYDWFDKLLAALQILIPMTAGRDHYVEKLDEIRKQCIDAIGNASSNPKIHKKINEYIHKYVSEKERFLPMSDVYENISSCKDSDYTEQHYYSIPVSDADLRSESLLSNGAVLLLVENVYRQVWKSYHYIFVKTSPRKKYYINGGEVPLALNLLGVDNNYIILFSRISKAERKYLFSKYDYHENGGIETINGARIQQMPGSTRFCIILRKEQMPYCKPVAFDMPKGDFEETEPRSLIFTNAKVMVTETESVRYLQLVRSFEYHEPKDFLKYIKLEIQLGRTSQLDTIKPFADSIPPVGNN